MRRSLPHLVLAIAALAGVYYVSARMGLSLAFFNASATPVWPPTGIALVALLLWGYRLWPAILIGAFFANLRVNHQIGASLAIAIGNTLEAVVGAWLTRVYAGGRRPFNAPRDIIRFALVAAVLSTIISAVIGETTLCLAGINSWATFLPVFITWWLGDMISDLVVAPFLLLWLMGPPPRYRLPRLAEAFLLLAALLMVCQLVFGNWFLGAGNRQPLEYLAIPLLLWAAYRFHQRGAATATVLMSAVAIAGTLRGFGPFGSSDHNLALLQLQAFVGSMSITALVLASVVAGRLKIENALRASEDKFRQISQSGVISVAYFDFTGVISDANDAFLRMIDHSSNELRRGLLCWDQLAPAQWLPRISQAIEEIKWRGKCSLFETELVRRDGSRFWGLMGGARVENGGGVAFVLDITDRKRAAEALAGAVKNAEDANRAKDEFLAVLSHELRTPLTPVLLTASLLENDTGLSAATRADVQSIRRNVELEARLIDDLLDLTRITRGKLQLNAEIVDVHDILRAAVDICCRDQMDRLRLDLAAQRRHVRGDPARLQQVFWNLLKNAVKFTPGSGAIRVGAYNDSKNRLIVEVADEGVGIDPELLPRIFNAFEQGGSATTRRFGGLGLGLAITRALVEAHGGRIIASSAGKNQGATFRVERPALPPLPAPAVTAGVRAQSN